MSEGPETYRIVPPGELDLPKVRLELTKAITPVLKAAAWGIARQWDKAGAAAVDVLSAVGIGPATTGELAWKLFSGALSRAAMRIALPLLRETYGETESKFGPEMAELVTVVMETWNEELQQHALTYRPELLHRPDDLPALAPVAVAIEKWLVEQQVDPDAAASGVRGLGEFFTYALDDEWTGNPDTYKPLSAAFSTPAGPAVARRLAWAEYRRSLQEAVEEPLFGQDREATGHREVLLSEVFLWPRAGYAVEEPEHPDRRRAERKRRVVDLRTELDRWLESGKGPAVRVISGGPGSGKSSFAKMYAAHRAGLGSGGPVVYVPLHRFDSTGDLAKSLSSYLRECEDRKLDPLDADACERELLLIFDGLDELEAQGKAATELAEQFVQKVITYTDRVSGRCRLRVLLGGREIAVQAVEKRLDGNDIGTVLELISYYVPDNERDRFLDPDGLLPIDQRDAWWSAYGAATGRGYVGLPAEYSGDNLREISSQPLLSYLLALVHRPGHAEPVEPIDRNSLYERLIAEVHRRRWGIHRHAVGTLELADFFLLMEEIGLVAFQGSGRTIRLSEVKRCCEEAGLIDLYREISTDEAHAAMGLLASFYTRKHPQLIDGEPAFEFTHKSFGEYLAARRLARLIEEIDHKRRERKPIDRWNDSDCLVRWAAATGPALLSENLVEFLQEDVAARAARDGRGAKEVAAEWQESLVALMNAQLQAGGFPMELLLGVRTFPEMARWARNAEAALLIAASKCASTTRIVSEIQWPDVSAVRRWVAGLDDASELVARHGLSYVRLADKDLNYAALACAVVVGSDLANASLSWATLSWAKLSGANLSGANLYGANLERVVLYEANLPEANLVRANLYGANLETANLSEANLSGADLSWANLSGANLTGADLSWTSLSRAYLTGANLFGANLSEANLFGADLSWADLSGANLSGIQWDEFTKWPKGFTPPRRSQ